MRVRHFVFGFTLAASAPFAALAADESPAIVKLRTTDTQVASSGLYTRTEHIEIRASNAAAAMEIGQQSLPFNETMEDLEVLEAYTAKAGGEKIPIGPNAIYTQQPQGSPQFPLFNDRRQKVVVFPNVGAGDTVAYTARWRTKKAVIPGQFTYNTVFPRGIAYQDVRETLVAPKSFPLQVENHEVAFEKQESGDIVTYRWRYSAPTPSLQDPPAVSPFASLPRISVSSFKDYDAFSRTYADIAASKETITPRIDRVANEVTGGISDRRQQAQAIYEWVSKNVRYVAEDIGNGGIVPHEADLVLANAYGDCKDHAVLFSALLKAKGIASETVLINLGNEYSLPNVATIAPMNHAITWLPEFQLYADTTAGTAPFGALPFEEYGKPVIHAVTSGRARRQIPVLAPGTATVTLKTDAKLDKDGNVNGTAMLTATGPFSTELRSGALYIQRAGGQRSAAALLQREGLVGTGDFDFPPPTDLGNSYTLRSNFSFGPKPEYVAGVRFDMARGPWLMPVAGDYLMGPLFDEKLKDTEPTACFSGRIIEEMTLQAPSGLRFRAPPQNMDLRTGNLEFRTRWAVSGDSIVLRREFVSRMDRPWCEADIRRETAKAFSDIRRHYQFDLVSLVPSGATTPSPVNPSPAPGPSADPVEALLMAGDEAVAARDWGKAVQSYSLALAGLGPAGDPGFLALAFTSRGFAYEQQGDSTKAISDFTQALRVAPNDYEALTNRGDVYLLERRYARAEADYTAAIGVNGMDAGAYASRATAFYNRGLFRRAEQDCTAALAFAPNDRGCYTLRSRMHYLMADYANAIAIAAEGIRVAPDETDVYFDRGIAYLGSGQYARAIADFDSALKLEPAFPEALFARGVAKMRLGQRAAGDADIAAAKKLETDIADRVSVIGISTARYNPGTDELAGCNRVEAKNGDILQALFFCNRALVAASLNSVDKAAASGVLGRMYYKSGEWDEAVAYLSRTLQLVPGEPVVLAMRALAYAESGHNEAALADMNLAMQTAGADPNVRMMRALYFRRRGQREQALGDFTEVIRQAPNSMVGYFSRAKLYEEADQYDKAIADLNAAIRLEPSAETYGARCAVLAYTSLLTAAMTDCERALMQDPDDVEALSTRGLINYKLGQDTKAAEDFERALEADPDAKLAYYGRGILKLKHGDRSGDDDIAEAIQLDAEFVARLRRRGIN